MLSRMIAEYADAGIKVLDLNPGNVDTDMWGVIRASGAATAVGHIPRSALAIRRWQSAISAQSPRTIWQGQKRFSGIQTRIPRPRRAPLT